MDIKDKKKQTRLKPYSTDIKDYWRRSWGLEDRKNDGVKYIGTRHEDWPVNEKKIFPEQQIKHKADKIVGDHYKKQKNKPPLTQLAENAVKELSFKMKDGFIENNEGTARTNSVKEAIEINEALDENLLDHQRRDYLKKLERFGIEHSQTKHPDYPKVSNPPILRKNINNQKITNPTVNKYRAFKEKQKKKLEDKKFDEQFKKEYSDKAVAQWLRAKENKNRIAGKHPYENFSFENKIVAEDFKDKAKARMKALNTTIERNQEVDDISEKISLLKINRNQMEEDIARQKREYDKVMKKPVDEDLYKGLGNFDPRYKK